MVSLKIKLIASWSMQDSTTASKVSRPIPEQIFALIQDQIQETGEKNRYKEMHKKFKVLTYDKPRSRGSKSIKNKDGHVIFDEKEKNQKEIEYHQTLY